MALEQRELAAGTKLVGTYKKTAYVCEVVTTPEGETRYRLEDGKLFKSPSSAAKAVMGGISANGWRFWSLEGTQSEHPAKAEPPQARAKAGKGLRPEGHPHEVRACASAARPVDELGAPQ